jgi:SAM-dependent methyltransferase
MLIKARGKDGSRSFWDEAAAEDAAWYIATGAHTLSEDFFVGGAAETDFYLAMSGVPRLRHDATVIEIGCGVGRMTRRLSELAGRVIAADVSSEMLRRCRLHLTDRSNVDYVLLPGDGALAGVPDSSVDLVFSYITLQHVPDAQAQLRYLTESVRVLREGGHAALQVRATGWPARAVDWTGHVGHWLTGRRTLHAEWRGARVAPARIQTTARRVGASVKLMRHGRRHLWIILTRPNLPWVDPQ